MGLIYADLELVSAEDVFLERRGCIKNEQIKGILQKSQKVVDTLKDF
jgi:hypothetical protein